jgi:tetratricopeptide (TPR) repeat protein
LAALAALMAALGAMACGFIYYDRPLNHYRRALQALARDDFEQVQYEALCLQGRPEYEAHASLINGILLMREERLDDAMEEFRLAAEDLETRALALMLVGRMLLEQQRFNDGQRALEIALQYDPDMAEAHGCLGAAYFDVGDLISAFPHLLRAAELSPHDPRPHRLMASIHRTMDQADEATDDLRESLRRGGARMPPQQRQEIVEELAQLQVHLLQFSDALESLRGAGETAGSLGLRAECHFALGEIENASQCAAAALRLDPEHFQALWVAGRIALETNDVPLAVETLSRALKVRPKSPMVLYALSQAMKRLGNEDLAAKHSEAAEQFREADQKYAELIDQTTREPRNADSRFHLGLMAERLGLEPAAVGWYRAAILIDPQHALARERLAQLPGGLANLSGHR